MKGSDTADTQTPEGRSRRQTKSQGNGAQAAARASEDVVDTAKNVAKDATDRVADTGRHLRHDATVMAESMTDAASEIQGYLREQTTQRPYVALGAAAGVGFVLGGGLSVRLTTTLLTVGGRILLTALWQQVTQNATTH